MTGQAYASFLLGWPSGAGRILPLEAPGCESCTEAHMKQDLYHFYLQDDIKVSWNLTVNIGLRYEYSPPWHEKVGRIQYFTLENYERNVRSTAFPQAPRGDISRGDRPGAPKAREARSVRKVSR